MRAWEAAAAAAAAAHHRTRDTWNDDHSGAGGRSRNRGEEEGQGHVRLDAIGTNGAYGQKETSAEFDDVAVAAARNADEVRQQQRRVACHRSR